MQNQPEDGSYPSPSRRRAKEVRWSIYLAGVLTEEFERLQAQSVEIPLFPEKENEKQETNKGCL